MKEFQSHKKVQAARIAEVSRDSRGFVAETEDGQVWDDQAIYTRGEPTVGDYIVVYLDGYVSWSPAKAFEEGYSEPNKPVPLHPDQTAIQLVDAALKGISKGQMNTGGGFGCRDYWATIGGVEYFISMQRSKRQNLLDQWVRLPPSEELIGTDRST